MQPITKEYLDIIAEFQIHLIQEYSPQSWLGVSRESYLHYRTYAIAQNQGARQQETNKSPEPIRSPEQVSKKPETVSVSHEPVVKPQAIAPKVPSATPVQEKSAFIPKTALLEQPVTIKKQDFSDIRKIIAERFPEQIILPQPPDDSMAKAIKDAWKNNHQKPEIFLVVAKAQSRHAALLENLCKAIKIAYNMKAEVVDKIPLGDVREHVIELADLDAYLREPKLKANLWQTISQRVKGE